MKFRNYLESIADVGVYPLIALILFVVIFSVVCIYAFKQNQQTMDEQSNIPLN